VILADTHVLAWWLLDAPQLSRTHATRLDAAIRRDGCISIAAITLLELAMAVQRGRLQLEYDRILELEGRPDLQVLPLSARVAVEAVRLGPSAPRDPADRLIIATARIHGATLLTADGPIRDSGLVEVG
jgi:PIN domain nuclease of toxin-antitoxin system